MCIRDRYKDYLEAIEKMVHYKRIYEPNKENSEIYEKLFYRVYKRIYPQLKNIYSEIQQITNYPDI